ncbi:MAG: DUF4837 family protein [Candidatus Competibacteraceae bacterium]|nr:DUF4837 family protein [Candidatus Competibacteraceae bacterium]
MKNKRFAFALAAFIMLNLIACNGDKGILPSSTGKEGELLLIVDEKYWHHSIGDTLRQYLLQDYPALPQSEPLFRLYKIFPKNFTRSFKTNKNILIIHIDPTRPINDPLLEIGYDNWAKDQLAIKLTCHNPDEFFDAFRQKRQRIIELFRQKDLERYQKKFKQTSSVELSKHVREKMNISLPIPDGFYVSREDSNFVYLSHDAMKKIGGLQHQITRGIMIYSFPYTDPSTFTTRFVNHLRDSLTQRYVEGSAENSYMIIEQLYSPDSASTAIQNKYALETRGLWRMENYFMGGPFINYITLDEPNNRIIMLDGFIFAPRFDKRDYIIQMEALLKMMSPS